VLLRFSGLPPAADAGSLRAQTSLGHIEGLRSEERVLDESFAKRILDLDAEVHKLELELSALREQQGRDDSAVQLGSRYEQLAQTMIERELSEPAVMRSWSAALDAVLKTRIDAAAARQERSARQRDLERRLEDLHKQRQRQQAAASRRELLAEVLLACPPEAANRSAEVELSYRVGGASWSPVHEARLLEGEAAVALTSYALLAQSTGEDWRAAQITLSTAVPSADATPPTVETLRVYADPRQPPKKVLVSREEKVAHAEEAKEERGPAAEDRKSAASGPLPKRSDQGLSVQFLLPNPADIPGDGTPSRLVMGESRLAGRLVYRTVPKLMPYVYRVADLINSSGYPLLPGPLDAFRKGQFLARYELDSVPSGARFQLTFGLEDRLKVKRHIIEEIARDQGLFGGTRRYRYVYRFEVINYLEKPQEVELQEPIAVSELGDVKVGLAQETSSGYSLNTEDGIMTYRLALRPGEKRLLSLSYFVDVPSSYLE
jgi:uncharacterized protein (TIGR02231 family)